MKHQTILTLVMACTASALTAAIDVTLPGVSDEASWENLNSTTLTAEDGYNTFFSNTAGWTTPVAADSGSAVFDKVPGTGGFPSSSSIYNFDQIGSFNVSDDAPLSGIETIVFQIDMVAGMVAAPTLNFNGGTQALVADYGAFSGNFSGMGSDSVQFVYQWDLSGVIDEITDYNINWSSNFHASNYRMQINTGDTYTEVVPEPSTYALIAGVMCSALIFMRRQRR